MSEKAIRTIVLIVAGIVAAWLLVRWLMGTRKITRPPAPTVTDSGAPADEPIPGAIYSSDGRLLWRPVNNPQPGQTR